MSTVPVVPGAAGGAVTGARNMGLPVLAGKAGNNQFSPTSGIPSVSTAGTANPLTPLPSSVTGTVPGARSAMPNNPNQALGTVAQPVNTAINTQPTIATNATATPAAGPANNGNPIAGYTPQQSQQLQKQLTDIYGKGEGGELFSMLSNLGSNDSSYMDAYHSAMAKTQAEGLSTIDTGLGNSGISSNSSAAAIEKGDYLSGLSSQEGLQEQQLLQTQQQEAISLIQGTQQDAQKENSTSWLDTLSQVAGVAGTFVGDATGLSGIGSAAKGALGAIGLGGGSSVPTLPNISSGADPLGLQAPTLPVSI